MKAASEINNVFLFTELVRKESMLPNVKKLKSSKAFDDFNVSSNSTHAEPSSVSFNSLVSDQYNSGSSSE